MTRLERWIVTLLFGAILMFGMHALSPAAFYGPGSWQPSFNKYVYPVLPARFLECPTNMAQAEDGTFCYSTPVGRFLLKDSRGVSSL